VADRGNHYEKAFEAYLRTLRVTCISVDESRRTFQENQTIKSLDFIVTGSGGILLVEVKGRHLERPRATRQNWATVDDIDGLFVWQRQFGPGALALLTFVYELGSEEMKGDFVDHFSFADRHYGCLAVPLTTYAERMRVRSPRWRTMNLTKADFDRVARPFTIFLRDDSENEDFLGPECHPTSTTDAT
jgi:hypothetical protein